MPWARPTKLRDGLGGVVAEQRDLDVAAVGVQGRGRGLNGARSHGNISVPLAPSARGPPGQPITAHVAVLGPPKSVPERQGGPDEPQDRTQTHLARAADPRTALHRGRSGRRHPRRGRGQRALGATAVGLRSAITTAQLPRSPCRCNTRSPDEAEARQAGRGRSCRRLLQEARTAQHRRRRRRLFVFGFLGVAWWPAARSRSRSSGARRSRSRRRYRRAWRLRPRLSHRLTVDFLCVNRGHSA